MFATSTPFETLLQVSGGYCLSRCLHAVANLGVADVLENTPQTAAALAEATGANAAALDRVLRLLSAYGVFEKHDGAYGHTPASQMLRTDHPQSMRSLARMFGLPGVWATMGELEHSIRTGFPAADKAVGGLWKYFSDHPEAGQIFNEAMMAKAHGQVSGVVATYDFSGFKVIGDIGGGRGHLLRGVLASAPSANGILFDLPQVIEQATDTPSERLRLQPGDFFKDALPVCDAYLLMEVIHDWSDEESTRILQAVRRAAPVHAKVLLIEAIVLEDCHPSWPKILDMWMLTLGGLQRTQAEYAKLLAQAGFRFTREIDTGANVSIIEAVPV